MVGIFSLLGVNNALNAYKNHQDGAQFDKEEEKERKRKNNPPPLDISFFFFFFFV
jgi:hypothetical protein